MLRELNQSNYKNYLDWAYSLALDMTRSGYPTYADGLKSRAEFDVPPPWPMSGSTKGPCSLRITAKPWVISTTLPCPRTNIWTPGPSAPRTKPSRPWTS